MKNLLFRSFLLLIGFVLLFPSTANAETFDVHVSDVDGLIAAMNAANANGPSADVINLETGTYTLSAVDNEYLYVDQEGISWGGGPNALPVVMGSLTINGNSSVIERAPDAPHFRFFLVSGNLTLNTLTLRGGQVVELDFDGFGYLGGAIYNAGELTINDSILTRNKARAGGAIANNGPSGGVSLSHVTITDNYSRGDAGGIFNNGYGSLLIESSTISDNFADDSEQSPYSWGVGGGISFNSSSTISIHDSSITGNRTTSRGRGGGLYVTGSQSIDIGSDSTFSGNISGSGGGIYNEYTPIRLTGVTIADNQGGGLFSGVGPVSFRDTLLSNNLGDNCATLLTEPLFTSQGNNLDTDGTCHLQQTSDINNVSAQTAPLADNGGPTLTHALLPDSPAINAGNNAVCSIHDQRGASRNGGCDIGAFEVSTLPTVSLSPVSSANGEGISQLQLSLKWTRVPNAISYDIQFGATSDLSDAPIISIAFPTYRPSPLLHQRYYWRVRSISHSAVASDWTPIWSFTVQSLPNDAPQLNLDKTTYPLLTWNRISWASGYAVEIADNAAFKNPYWHNNLISSSTFVAQPDKPLHTGQWYWRVKARKPDGTWGSWSVIQLIYVDASP